MLCTITVAFEVIRSWVQRYYPANMSERDLREAALDLLAKLVEEYPIGFEPVLLWKRLRVSAGIANYAKRTIALSSILLTDEARMRDTLCHEYAHFIAFARHGRSGAGHGPGWKSAMSELGLLPEVHHCYSVCRNVPRQEVAYVCARCNAVILRNRRLARRRRYVHSACGGPIRFAGVRPLESAP